MSEEEDEEPSSEDDFEDLMEAIQEERQERQEQVSFEWVETVREAGELWRDIGDVETVADETDLSVETTKEALTVYRLIFEDPSDVATKASRPSRAYFSLERELKEEFDEENDDEPVEDLLREYVGALYLDHDIEDLSVGEPPEEETPPLPFDWEELDLDMSEIVSSIEIPASTVAAVANISDIHDTVLQNQTSLLAGVVGSELFRTEKMVASALQPIIAQQEMALARSLAPLTAVIEEQQNMVAQSAALMLSDVIADIRVPQSVLADLAAIQPSVSAAAAASSYPSSQFVNSTSTTSVDAEPLEATAEVVPETGPAEATVDATLPDAGSFSFELALEVPTQITYFILAGSETREWFNEQPTNYQRAVIGGIAGYIAYSMTSKWGAAGYAAAVLTPLIRQMLKNE
ncbi:hypothetical protein [Halapricum hydrolyticum]|uniref:Uncharacterized protein n=1 Tax=Halapricum hydrolyticum TaxID=2979991 RepID=A0AAE3IDN3_9EURY|nr:hypothetical protein [Halapricum hydrolyticum]MCU4718042.1 hypothetical protein [Halapricum hydrolyticum]MCU4728620.1 hypothetical protein [Halapricum hydrolyticum]